MTTESKTSHIDEDALAYILSMPKGRKVIWDMLAVAGVFHQPRVVGDNEATHFNCGSLNVGLILYADCLIVSPDLTAMMIKEQGNADRTDNTSSGNARSNPSGIDASGKYYSPGGNDPQPDDAGLSFGRVLPTDLGGN